jgi:hypothetical protein
LTQKIVTKGAQLQWQRDAHERLLLTLQDHTAIGQMMDCDLFEMQCLLELAVVVPHVGKKAVFLEQLRLQVVPDGLEGLRLGFVILAAL